jgi:4-hydroxysphinganine ceramide fatty acyl 2-hydroxylase
MYDEIHYWIHHSSPQFSYLKDIKLYHMQHHYKFGTIGFGVSNKLWDYVFRTEITGYDKTYKTK